jgi:hemerythrin superfamily protein
MSIEEGLKAENLPEEDGIRILLEQHEHIKRLFADVEQHEGDAKREAFEALVRLLAVHETAEEMVVRPTTRTRVPDGDAIADARIQEEDEAKQMLADLEAMDPEAARFDATLHQFRDAVVHHAEREEREEFPQLHKAQNEDDRRALGLAIRAAEATAPTHPHPAGPSSPLGHLVVGPFAAVVDRARDALRDAMQRR